MAYQGKGIFDGFTGSVGNLTGYKRNGKSVIKSKNPKRTKPPTPAQEQTHQYFKWIDKIYNEALLKGWGNVLNKTCGNYSIKDLFYQNIKYFFGQDDFQSSNINLLCTNDNTQTYLFQNFILGDIRVYRIQFNRFDPPVTGQPNDLLFRIQFYPDENICYVNPYADFRRSQLDFFQWGFTEPIAANTLKFDLIGYISDDHNRIFNFGIIRRNQLP